MPSAKTIRQFLGGGGNFPNIDSARRPFLFGKYGWDIFFWCGFRNFQVPNFDPQKWVAPCFEWSLDRILRNQKKSDPEKISTMRDVDLPPKYHQGCCHLFFGLSKEWVEKSMVGNQTSMIFLHILGPNLK